jgi:hypothetical protein
MTQSDTELRIALALLQLIALALPAFAILFQAKLSATIDAVTEMIRIMTEVPETINETEDSEGTEIVDSATTFVEAMEEIGEAFSSSLIFLLTSIVCLSLSAVLLLVHILIAYELPIILDTTVVIICISFLFILPVMYKLRTNKI